MYLERTGCENVRTLLLFRASLAHDGDHWRAVVNTVMNLRVPQNVGKFLSAERLAASQEGLSSTEYLVS
jgi:hypothetical protein